MANEFYQPGEQRAAQVRALFARIASRYDRLNDLQSFGLHRHWKRRLLDLAAAGPGQRALDLCCGTGDLALGLAGRGALAAGLDFSAPMLAVAEGRARSQGRPGPSFFRGDAQVLPFRDESFDVVTVGYGLRNLADWELGLREMHRVARPGGRLLVLDFGKPDSRLWRWVYFNYLRALVPVLGLVFCGSFSAYAYILESLQHYPAQHAVAARMREMGLVDVQIHNFLGGMMTINCGVKNQAGGQS